MIAHVFFRLPSQFEVETIISSHENNFQTYVYGQHKSSFKTIPVELIELDLIKKNVNYDFFRNVIAFGDKKIVGNDIADRLNIKGQSLWHYHKFRCYFLVREALYEMEYINKLMSSFDRVYLHTANSYLSNQLFESHKVNVVHSKENKNFKITTNHISFIKYLVFLFLNFVKGFFTIKPKGKHIIIDKGIRQLCINPLTLNIGVENIFIENILRKAGKQIVVTSDTDIPSVSTDFKLRNKLYRKLKRHNANFNGEFVIARSLFSLKIWQQSKQAITLFREQIAIIEKNTSETSEKLIVKYLKSHIHSSFAYAFKFNAWLSFFKKYKALSVISIDENSPMVMSIMDAARFHNIKCIALQHGSIHNLHPAYIHSKGDLGRNVYPDLTLVWGQYWSNFLIYNANYPASKLLITGQQRTDSIPAFLQNFETIKKMLGFEDKKIILFASQPQQDKALRYRAAYDVFTAAIEYPNLLFVVKLHPNELNDSDYYHHIAIEVGCKNYKIDSSSDLYAILAISEIVITCFSTVGSEALYFKKPVIILDHLKADLLGLIKQNLALRATNSKELVSAISTLERGENVTSNLAAEEFIHQYAYKIDGCVSDRILSIIREVNSIN